MNNSTMRSVRISIRHLTLSFSLPGKCKVYLLIKGARTMGLVCSNLQWPLLVTWWCMTEMGRLHQCATKMRGKGMQKKQNTVEFSMYRCRNLKKSHWSCKGFSQIIVRWELWVLYYDHYYYYYYYYHHLLRYKITLTLQNPQQSIHWSYGEPMGTIAWWKRCGTPGLLGEIVGAMWWT